MVVALDKAVCVDLGHALVLSLSWQLLHGRKGDQGGRLPQDSTAGHSDGADHQSPQGERASRHHPTIRDVYASVCG